MQRGAAGRGDRAVVRRDHARGQAALQAQRVADGEDGVADRRRTGQHRGHDDLREPVDGEHGDVDLRLARRDLGGARVPSANSTWIWVAPSTTCRAVSTAPSALTTTPLPRPVSVGGAPRALRGDGDQRGRDHPVRGGGVGRRVALGLLRPARCRAGPPGRRRRWLAGAGRWTRPTTARARATATTTATISRPAGAVGVVPAVPPRARRPRSPSRPVACPHATPEPGKSR